MYLCEPVKPFSTAALASSNFTTKQNVSALPLPVIEAGRLRQGSKLYVRAYGDYSSLTGASLTVGLWFGNRAGTITGDLALAGAFTTGTTPAAWPWFLEWDGVLVTAPGTAASILGQGSIQFGSSLTAFNTNTPFPLTAAARTVSIDTTIERAIGVSATWGAASASNIITVNDTRVMYWN